MGDEAMVEQWAKCICMQPETAFEGNPTGHRGDCPYWGTQMPNMWAVRRAVAFERKRIIALLRERAAPLRTGSVSTSMAISDLADELEAQS